jgi:hypothetical protein
VEARVKAWAKSLPWLGALAAAVLLVNVNVLGARWYQRWDLTSERLYTLSQPTLELLQSLGTPVDVVVLLGKADPLALSVRHMLEAYGAESRQLRVRYVDPDRSPAELLALQQKYQILAGKADDGRVVTDAALVVSRTDERGSERHWFVTAEELVRFDEESGRSRPTLEAALSGAFANVLRPDKAKLCFATGQREPTLDDQGPQGLSELKQRLIKNNFEPESVDATSPQANYASCAALLVVTPELTFGADDARRVADYVRAGGSAVLLLGPTVDETQLVRPTGLEAVLELAGVTLGRDLVLEHDQAQRLPQGNGEAFFGKLRAHALTRGVLHEDDKLSSRVLVVQARSLEASGGASLLLTSSDQASSLENLSWLLDPSRLDSAPRRLYGLAAARELAKPAGSQRAHGARLVVSGASNLAWNRNFQDPGLYGNRRLLENAISWVAARPSMISVPEKEQREVGLSLSDESLGEVLRYVLVYMPLSAGLIGAFVLLRRRKVERRSRQAPSEG